METRITRRALLAAGGPPAIGMVGISGPHPEATPDWYASNGLPSWYTADKDIGDALISTLMR